MSDLVYLVRHLRADQDAIALIATLQAQFPQDRIHLLIGFASGEVYCTGGDDRGHEPVEIASDDPRWNKHEADQDGTQPNVMARYCTVSGIVLVSVPPSEDAAFHNARFPIDVPLSTPTTDEAA